MKIVTRKQLRIDEELLSLCKRILAENKSDSEWSDIESSDMFQSPKYNGGYEAAEQAFWFSYYDETNMEWWFEITTDSVNHIISGELQYLDLYEPI